MNSEYTFFSSACSFFSSASYLSLFVTITEEIMILKATKKSQTARMNSRMLPKGTQMARLMNEFFLKIRFQYPRKPFI